jgi:YidC/Oxa1 family membrane protein insertase
LAEYKNPQQEPGGEKRLLVVFLATFVLMLLMQPLLKKYFPQPASTPAQTQTSSTSPQSSSAASSETAAPTLVAPGAIKQASSETDTVIENDLYRITFTNKGAQVKSWILKKFDNDTENGPLDLVNAAAAEKFGYPLSLWTYDETLRSKLSSVLYVPSEKRAADPLAEEVANVTVTSSKGEFARQTLKSPATITFEYSDQDLAVKKTFTFDQTYVVAMETSATYKGSNLPALPAWPAGFGDQTTPAFYAASLIDYQFNKNIERIPAHCGFSLFSKCTQAIGGATVPGPFHWAGPTDQYFAAVFIPDDPAHAAMVTLNKSMQIARDPSKPESKEVVPVDVVGAAVGNLNGTTTARIYAGPKELEVLQKIPVPGVSDNDLNGLVDFGWWGIIAKPLFVWLKWTYRHVVANWGWAIVIQTIIISAVLLPLRITQLKSMLKMQRIQPQIKSIQEKYKKYSLKDPRKAGMNEEIGSLYKKEGVNPAGGCLPLLIQMPFIFAYYRMLGTALDLRHAHWLWVKDLSAADPWLVLPILMVLSSLVTQRMTPQTGMDPQQQKMMNVMMPLMMGFIFFRLAAGLNLYYAVVNLIGIAQQSVMNRTALGREMREIMAKRARKKDK